MLTPEVHSLLEEYNFVWQVGRILDSVGWGERRGGIELTSDLYFLARDRSSIHTFVTKMRYLLERAPKRILGIFGRHGAPILRFILSREEYSEHLSLCQDFGVNLRRAMEDFDWTINTNPAFQHAMLDRGVKIPVEVLPHKSITHRMLFSGLYTRLESITLILRTNVHSLPSDVYDKLKTIARDPKLTAKGAKRILFGVG